jgi:hypothetical protein
MKQEFLELKKPLQALSEGLTVMVLETVDSLYAHQREALCRRYQLRNGAFSRV